MNKEIMSEVVTEEMCQPMLALVQKTQRVRIAAVGTGVKGIARMLDVPEVYDLLRPDIDFHRVPTDLLKYSFNAEKRAAGKVAALCGGDS